MRRLALLFPCAIAAAALGCPPESGAPGGGGTGGECPMGPVAMLDLAIQATSGPVPADLTLSVSWSAGDEPQFALADPKTWATIAQGANVVCDVSGTEPPKDLSALVCHLWTSGPTAVKVHAKGYVPYASTLVPAYSDRCKEPVPTRVEITLMPASDAGS